MVSPERKRSEVTMKTWPVCDECGGEVIPPDGYLAVDGDTILDRSGELHHWVWGHSGCTPNGYAIEASRIDSMEKALDWTMHLWSKRWFANTDWHHALQKLFPGIRGTA